MKRLILCVGILVLCFVLCFLAYNKLQNICIALNSSLESCAENLKSEDIKAATTNINLTEETLNKNIEFLNMITDDATVETIADSLKIAKYHLKDGNLANAIEIIRECQILVESIPESKKVSIANIF